MPSSAAANWFLYQNVSAKIRRPGQPFPSRLVSDHKQLTSACPDGMSGHTSLLDESALPLFGILYQILVSKNSLRLLRLSAAVLLFWHDLPSRSVTGDRSAGANPLHLLRPRGALLLSWHGLSKTFITTNPCRCIICTAPTMRPEALCCFYFLA